LTPTTTVEDQVEPSVEEPRYALILLFGRVAWSRRSVVLGFDPMDVGRAVDEEHHLRLQDPRASGRHAEIRWSEIQGRYLIRDLGSRNGTYLNGTRIAREILQPGDLLRVGNTVFLFGAAQPDAANPGLIAPPFVGRSRSLQLALDTSSRVAASDAPVLILGPTGTGKELVASWIHRASARAGPFLPVNCAALPSHLVESELFGHEKGAFSGAHQARPGLFRAAQRGTLFLDEVGELPADVQAKFLRVLDNGSIRPVGAAAESPVDARVVAATNRDLAEEVERGRFRADLYARLAECVIRLAPLRERAEDLEPLWRHFVAELGHGAVVEPSSRAFEAMALHSWPFNVRELRQLVRTGLLLRPQGGELSVEDLPAAMRPARPEGPADSARALSSAVPLRLTGHVPSKRELRRLVEEFRGNVKDVAAFLGKDRKQIYRWLRRDRIDPEAYRRGDE